MIIQWVVYINFAEGFCIVNTLKVVVLLHQKSCLNFHLYSLVNQGCRLGRAFGDLPFFFLNRRNSFGEIGDTANLFMGESASL